MNIPECEALRAFRQHLQALVGRRRDALFGTLDAALSALVMETSLFVWNLAVQWFLHAALCGEATVIYSMSSPMTSEREKMLIHMRYSASILTTSTVATARECA